MIWGVTNDLNTALDRGYIGELKARTFPELSPIALAVECGIMSFEAAFMPHMLLSTGERVIDRVQAQGLLPPATYKVTEK